MTVILKRYGKAYHSVQPNFNPAGITEIGFRRDRAFTMAADDFEEVYERLGADELRADAEGPVQRHAEKILLRKLEEVLARRVGELDGDRVLVVVNGANDWPKTRERREVVQEDVHNRYHFRWWIDPPLKVALWRKRGAGQPEGTPAEAVPGA